MDSKIINALLKSLISKAEDSENSKLSMMEPDVEIKKVSLESLPEDEDEDEDEAVEAEDCDMDEDEISKMLKLFKG